MSERIAEVIELKLEKHPNADALSLVFIDGFTVVVKTEDWIQHKTAIYIRPDEIVDTSREEFSWLKEEGKEKHRVKVKKLRGIYSMGLLIPAKPNHVVGQNVYEELGLEHWNPPEPGEPGQNFGRSRNIGAPPFFSSLGKYDIENGRGKYGNVFIDGETVFVMEKLNGANMSVTYTDNRICVHSRNQWPEKDEGNAFWRAALVQPNLIKYCEEHPNVIVYGEMIGCVSGYRYDLKEGEVSFRIFDIKKESGSWTDSEELVQVCKENGLLMAPIHGWMNYSFEDMIKLAETKSLLGCKISEGVVVRSRNERWDTKYGRAIAKFVSSSYLEKG